MSDNRICFVQTLLAVLAGLILTSSAFAQGNSAPNAMNDVIVIDVNGDLPVGPEFSVNTTTLRDQSNPSAAALIGGGFIIAWKDNSRIVGDTSDSAILAQRYAATGAAVGGEFLVNSTTARDQLQPSVAALSGGGFVVAYSDSSGADGNFGYGVLARRFDNSGTAVGPDFVVNTTTADSQFQPSVAALSGGGFVVAYSDSSGADGSGESDSDQTGNGILARRFDNSGAAVGPDFVVNTTITGAQSNPSIAALSGGGFVVVYTDSSGADGDGSGVLARVFDASGTAVGPDFVVNTTTADSQLEPNVAALSGGGFVVAYSDSSGADGDGSGVLARVFDASGTAVGPDFVVNTTTAGGQFLPDVAAWSGGGFVVAYRRDGGVGDISARRFDANGGAVGPDFVVNDTKVGSQSLVSVAALAGGDFVVAYNSLSGADGSLDGILSRMFTRPPLYANRSYPLDVLANDTDPDSDTLTITHVNGAAIAEGGTVVLISGASVTLTSGELVYNPRPADFAIALPAGVKGDDTFTYTTSDGALTDTANVTVTVTGVNDLPICAVRYIDINEDALTADITSEVLTNTADYDTGEAEQLRVNWISTNQTRGVAALNDADGAVTYGPNGMFNDIPLGTTRSRGDEFFYSVIDPSGGVCQSSTINLNIVGANDAPSADADALTFAEEEGARDVTASLLDGDADVDSGETAQLAITGVDTTLSLGRITLTNGIVTYDPNGAFNALSEGQSVTDRFDYTISDPHGATATATATVTINGFNGYRLTVDRNGLGTGVVNNITLAINCGGGGNCERLFVQGSAIDLFAFPAPGSRFAGWEGACVVSSDVCAVTMTADRAVAARFEMVNPPSGRIVAATLPGARSGYVGGGDITVFMTVLSRQSTPAQACRITAPNDPPFTLSYRQVNAQNEIIGDANPLFDLGNGGAINFVIALTPTRTTEQSGYVFLPQIQCENAELSPIEGVNSVLVSIGAAPVPDILSIGATPSADGVVRIPETGNRISFLSAAAVNIGAGDGSAGAGEATVTASVDTGAASLPLTLEVCETASTGGCITPRGVDNVATVFESNVVKFFAVFVRANGDSTVPFSPANARVFLRFTDANGTIRSATSAAVSAPAPAGDQPTMQSAMPVGRWSVLVRQGDGEWPSLVRASLFVLEDGTAILDNGTDITQLNFEGFVADDDIGRFENNDTTGAWTSDGAIQAGPILSDQPGDLWGVRDVRSDIAPGWETLAGRYGNGIQIASDGSISGTIGECIVSGRPHNDIDAASGLRVSSVNLMRCDASGEYDAVMDVPANDQEPTLLISGTGGGWRAERNH